MEPKLKDVMITVKTLETEKHKESKTIVTLTDENGAYRYKLVCDKIIFRKMCN